MDAAVLSLELNAVWLVDCGGAARPENRTQDTSAPSASRLVCAGPGGTTWNPGSIAFKRTGFPVSVPPAGARQRADRHDQHWLTGPAVLVMLVW